VRLTTSSSPRASDVVDLLATAASRSPN
jgi:hypothetical protein